MRIAIAVVASTMGLVLSACSVEEPATSTAPLIQPSSKKAAPAASTTTAEPTTTTTTTPPVPIQKYNGKGDSVLKITDPGPAGILAFDCPKCSGNVVVESNGAEGLLVNTIGKYTGKRWLNIEDGSITTQLVITAHGSWTATVGSFADLATVTTGAEMKGKGDDVIVNRSDATQAIVTNEGKGNFIVEVLSSTGSKDLAVNEIGSYSGTVPMSLPALIQITSEGSWLIVAGN